MTLYSVLVSNKPLPTLDCTGMKEITVGELKLLYPITKNSPSQPWHEMPDDTKLLHAESEDAFERLNIFEMSELPFDLEEINDKSYMYGIEGTWNALFLEDFLEYLKQSITKEQGAELIRFWPGDDEYKLKIQYLELAEIELHDLNTLKNEDCIRVIFV